MRAKLLDKNSYKKLSAYFEMNLSKKNEVLREGVEKITDLPEFKAVELFRMRINKYAGIKLLIKPSQHIEEENLHNNIREPENKENEEIQENLKRRRSKTTSKEKSAKPEKLIEKQM